MMLLNCLKHMIQAKYYSRMYNVGIDFNFLVFCSFIRESILHLPEVRVSHNYTS